MEYRYPSEETFTTARLYWQASDALRSEVPELRMRVDRGDLRQPFSEAYDLAFDASTREDFLFALIQTRRNNRDDLATLGCGFVEDAFYEDDEILYKLRWRGIPADVLVEIYSYIATSARGILDSADDAA